ncbi:MAG: hydantoinase/oxoprolinase family protein [Hyphomicrobiales bacterium]
MAAQSSTTTARFRVGPDSAGADPGPGYRRSGPLTVTDANVMTGKLQPDFFPHIFGPNQKQALDRPAVVKAFKTLARKLGDGRTPEEIADGFIKLPCRTWRTPSRPSRCSAATTCRNTS